jgi:hypothetical protein
VNYRRLIHVKIRRFSLILCLLAWSLSKQLSRSGVEEPPPKSVHPFCGTRPDRLQHELQLSRSLRAMRQLVTRREALTTAANATQDVGQIAVIEDDGTIVTPKNPFDLTGSTLRLAPVSPGSYLLSQRQETVGGSFGTPLSLADDDSREIAFTGGFRFPFFGATHLSVFINSDGNLTFGQGDSGTDWSLSRFNSGPPRIGGFFADLDPTAGGSVFYNAWPDRFVVTWDHVREYGGTTETSFQVTLFADGAFEFAYGALTARRFR